MRVLPLLGAGAPIIYPVNPANFLQYFYITFANNFVEHIWWIHNNGNTDALILIINMTLILTETYHGDVLGYDYAFSRDNSVDI